MKIKDSKTSYFGLPADPLTLYPPVGDASTLVLAVSPADYSASVIARAVEDCDAHLLNLNVSSERSEHGEMLVYIRVNHRRADSVARSVERFGYRVVSAHGGFDDLTEDTARDRVNELLRYLGV